MRLLVIGGGRFLGYAVGSAAARRGWDVTAFSRTGAVPADVQPVRGDRTDRSHLARLAAGGPWDVVIDVPGVVPAHVRDSAQALAPKAERYVFVSTVSAYADWPVKAVNEESPLRAGDPDEDPGQWTWGTGAYSRLKAGAEAALRREVPSDRLLVLRPGVVLGPGDYSGRLEWWLGRIRRGGPVLAPGRPDRPIQPVDSRDTAAFLLDLTERGASGVYNVATPPGHATYGELLDACRRATGGDAELVWADDDWLIARGVRQWSELPLWRTAAGTWRVDASRAHAAGLRCRPLAETVSDTWTWLAGGGRPADDPRRAMHGMSREREQELLGELLRTRAGAQEP